MKQLDIRIGVGGRFHADYMASAFLKAGHNVSLYTTFPASRFPNLSPHRQSNFLLPEIVYRSGKLIGLGNQGDQYKIKSFASVQRSPMFATKTPVEYHQTYECKVDYRKDCPLQGNCDLYVKFVYEIRNDRKHGDDKKDD